MKQAFAWLVFMRALENYESLCYSMEIFGLLIPKSDNPSIAHTRKWKLWRVTCSFYILNRYMNILKDSSVTSFYWQSILFTFMKKTAKLNYILWYSYSLWETKLLWCLVLASLVLLVKKGLFVTFLMGTWFHIFEQLF